MNNDNNYKNALQSNKDRNEEQKEEGRKDGEGKEEEGKDEEGKEDEEKHQTGGEITIDLSDERRRRAKILRRIRAKERKKDIHNNMTLLEN